MSDADDYYSDDDFASTSQDERFGLSSICEEPADSNDSPLPKTNPINAAREVLLPDEQKCNESCDSYSLDDDFASTLSRDQEPTTAPSSTHGAVSTDCECNDGDTEIISSVTKHCTPAETESQDSYSHDEATPHNRSMFVDDGDCNDKDTSSDSDDNFVGEVQAVNEDVEGKTQETPDIYIATNDCKEVADDSNKENEGNQTLPQQLQHFGKEGHTNIRLKPKKPAPLPRCATLSTKSMSIAHKTDQTDTTGHTQVKRKYSLRRLEELAKPQKHQMYRNDDSRKIAKQTKKIDGSSFLERMELMELERKAKAEFIAAEAKYDSKVDIDKLHCPKCGRIQSYPEVIGKSMNCKTDKCSKKKVQYQKKAQCNSEAFLARLERSTQRRGAKIDEIKAERRSSLTSQCNVKSRTQKALMKKVGAEGFIHRMQKDIQARQTKISRHVELMDESLQKAHSFKPNIHVPDHLIRNRKGGISALSAPSRRYTLSFEERLEECERKQGNRGATQNNSKLRAPIECPWGKKNYSEAKMKKQFQKAYM